MDAVTAARPAYRVMAARDIDRDEWSKFVRHHAGGSVFQTPEMYDVYEASKGYSPVLAAVADSRGRIVAVFLAALQTFGAAPFAGLSSRVIVHGGPLVLQGAEDCIPLLLQQYELQVRGKALYSQLRNLTDMSGCADVFCALGYEREDHLNVLIDLRSPESVRWSQLKHFRRKNIKRAERAGLIVREMSAADMNRAMMLLEHLYRRIRLPLPDRSFFEAVSLYCGNVGMARWFGAYLDETMLAFRLVLCYNGRIYDFYAAADEAHGDAQANAYLPWAVCKWGSTMGYSVFDFGGAGKPDVPYGVRDFKVAYGGELVNLGRFTKIHHRVLYGVGVAALSLWRKCRRRGRAG